MPSQRKNEEPIQKFMFCLMNMKMAIPGSLNFVSLIGYFAGEGEKLKNVVDRDGRNFLGNFLGNSILTRPFGDRKPDYFWNKMGMVAADYDKKIKATLDPKPRYIIPPTYIDATWVKPSGIPR